MLGLEKGARVNIEVDGPDEEQFADELVALLNVNLIFRYRVTYLLLTLWLFPCFIHRLSLGYRNLTKKRIGKNV